jgi:CMP-N,N'-diacetyllegionaminic acid synthase
VIIVIPARGGSKRLPLKNIYPLNGKPLLAYTLEAIAATGVKIPTYVSTDDEQIASVARAYTGVEVLMRPHEISSDTASTESVLLHVLDVLAKRGQFYQWVMTLAPTSPFRSSNTIRNFVEATTLISNDIDCIMSFTESRGDFWQMQDGARMKRLFPDAPRRQQERTPLFEENSAIYVTRTQALIETKFIFGRLVSGISIPWIEGFDINTIEDMHLAEGIYDAFKSQINNL